MGEGNSRTRLLVVGVIVVALFSGLLARLWYLQFATTASYAAQTRANRIRVISEPAVRGRIVDRNGKVLVENELVDSIQVRRGLTDPDRKRMVPALAKVLKLTQKAINKRLDSVRYSPYQPVPIKDRVSYDQAVYIKERPEVFPNVDVVRRSIRVYPFEREAKILYGLPSVAAHELGYVGAINGREQKLHKGEGYGPEDVIGKDGVEQVFETELRGKPRVRKLEVDSRGRLVRVLSDRSAQAGNDVQLTMDLDVQRRGGVAPGGHEGRVRPARPDDQDRVQDVRGERWCRGRSRRDEWRRDRARVSTDVRHHEVLGRHPCRRVQHAEQSEEQLPAARPCGPRSVRAGLDLQDVHRACIARGQHHQA